MNASFSSVKKGMNRQTIGRLGRYITSSKTLLLYPLFFPFLMILYVVTSSVMNKNSSGIVYLLGLLLTMFNNLLVNSMDYRETENYMKSDMCYAGIPFVSKYTNLSSPNTAVIVYTFFFFLSPAFLRNMHFIRSPLGLLDFFITRFKEVIIFFGIVLFLNGYSERILNCSNVEMNGVDIMNGMFVGMFSSWLYILIYYVTGNKNIITAMAKLQGQSTSCPNAIAQSAAVEALTGDQSEVIKMRTIFKKRRNNIVNRLNKMHGVTCDLPGGAFYVFPNFFC